MNNFICKHCGTNYTRKKSIIKTSFCSLNCKYKHGQSKETLEKIKLARKNQVFKVRPIIRTGYLYIKDWKHPNCGKQGYVAIHRLIVEKKLNRYLTPEEVVHHIDGNPLNNSIENLQLFATHGEHTKMAHPEIALKSSIVNKGQRRSIKTEFKKGQIPWNKN